MNEEASGYTQKLEELLDKHQGNDIDCFDQIIELSMMRIQQLAHRKLLTEQFIHRHIQTDDLFQNASMRLYQAMKSVHPKTKNDFMRLAATMIRREILDTARQLRKRYHLFPASLACDAEVDLSNFADDQASYTPEQWILFHEAIDQLDEEEKLLFELLFYEGNTQQKAAEILGISPQSVYRGWRRAKIKLGELLS
ncbi:MAG: sigma-70 family RNA polymerase sigma factor [Planctomycetia bacterium]|nr:sigma-70 family RNA polymerase sigma factor [Planctomycetia bacterium]